MHGFSNNIDYNYNIREDRRNNCRMNLKHNNNLKNNTDKLNGLIVNGLYLIKSNPEGIDMVEEYWLKSTIKHEYIIPMVC